MWKGFYPLTIAGIFLAILVLSISPVSDRDIWWHLGTGKYILESGTVPYYDIFSYTVPQKEWIDHEWLSQIIFYSAYDKMDYTGLVLVKSIALLGGFFFLFRRAGTYTGKTGTILTLLAVVAVSKDAWFARPMIFTFVFVSFYLFILESKRGLWTLPFITVIWVNLHGSFIIGLGILFIFVVGTLASGDLKEAKKIFLTLLVSMAASLANPYTYEILFYPFQYATNSIHTIYIAEWQAPKFHTFSVYEAMILSTFVALGLKRGISATNLMLLIAFTHFSLFAVRNISLYGFICAPIIIGHLEKGIKDLASKKYVHEIKIPKQLEKGLLEKGVPAFTYTAVILSFALFFYPYLIGEQILDTNPAPIFPEDAVEYIKENRPPGELFNLYSWGGYCIWTLYPEYKVFIDGRADMYGDFIFEYFTVHNPRYGWNDVLDKYNVSIILIPQGSSLDVLLIESEAWESVYRDEIAVVYTRKPILAS